MSQPAKPFNPSRLSRTLTQQSWLVFAMIGIAVMAEASLNAANGFVISKNLLAGSVLAWLGQWVFAKIALSVSGYQQRRQVVHRFYVAQMAKWVISLIGFALIFKFLKPLNALWVFIGFMLIQFSHTLLMLRFNSQRR